jgi:hypothetical protein
MDIFYMLISMQRLSCKKYSYIFVSAICCCKYHYCKSFIIALTTPTNYLSIHHYFSELMQEVQLLFNNIKDYVLQSITYELDPDFGVCIEDLSLHYDYFLKIILSKIKRGILFVINSSCLEHCWNINPYPRYCELCAHAFGLTLAFNVMTMRRIQEHICQCYYIKKLQSKWEPFFFSLSQISFFYL